MRWAPVFAILLLAALAGALYGYRALNTSSASSPPSLVCSVRASCGSGEVAVLRMSSTANAHAGTPGGSSYGSVVCCSGFAGLTTSCSGVYDTVLTLSAADNAHAASDASYGTSACLSVGVEGTVDCRYGASCGAGYACLATISGSTNAHVADCNGVDDYGTKVCCLALPDNCPTVSNPGQENSDGDQWGDACDNCPTKATSWFVPLGDEDCDGFTTAVETHAGTQPLDGCPDDSNDDAWPADIQAAQGCGFHNGQVNVLDVLCYKPKLSGPYDARYDLDATDTVNILDVLLFKPVYGGQCTNP